MQKVLKYKKLEVILKMVFMHIQFCQERRISMDEKLLEDDEDEDEDITALSVIYIDGFREIITEDDVL